MGKIEDLAAEFERHICIPWQRTVAGAQRVVMVVYEKELERTLRARIAEFQQRTEASGHTWIEHDFTTAFAEWMAAQDYQDAYFEEPEVLDSKIEGEFLEHVVAPVRELLRSAGENAVVALTGVGSLYGFVHVSQVVKELEPDIEGRLVVFFPGSKTEHIYRLLDARDGWNYLAHSITHQGSGDRA